MSVGARQLSEFREFILQAADLKPIYRRVDPAGGDRYIVRVYLHPVRLLPRGKGEAEWFHGVCRPCVFPEWEECGLFLFLQLKLKI